MIEKKKGSGAPWSDWEHGVIHDYYPTGGASACMERLPHRKRTAIQARAHLLGVHHTASKFSQPWKDRPAKTESETVIPIPTDDRSEDERMLARMFNEWRYTPSPMFGVPMVGVVS